MSIVLHLLLWFFKQYRVLITSYLACLVFVYVASWLSNEAALTMLTLIGSIGFCLTASILVLRLVQSQPYSSSDSFWQSRPFTPRQMALSQLAFVCLAVGLPFLLFLLLEAFSLGGTSEHYRSVMFIFAIYFGMLLTLFSAAVLTRGVVGVSALILGGFFAFALVGISYAYLMRDSFELPGWVWNYVFPGMGLGTLVLVFLPKVSFVKRQACFVLSIMVLPIVLAPVVIKTMWHPKMRFEKRSDGNLSRFEVAPSGHLSRAEQSALSYTTITEQRADVIHQPVSAEIPLSDGSQARLEYSFHHATDNEPNLRKPLVADLVLRNLPEDTRLLSTVHQDDQYERRLFRAIIRKFKEEGGQTLRGHLKKFTIEKPVEGELIARRYQLTQVTGIPLAEGASATHQGIRVMVNDLEREGSALRVRLNVLMLTRGLSFQRRRGRPGRVAWVVYSPSKQQALLSQIDDWTISDHLIGPNVCLQRGHIHMALPESFATASDLELRGFFVLRQGKAKLPLAMSPGTYHQTKETQWDWDTQRRKEFQSASDQDLTQILEQLEFEEVKAFTNAFHGHQNVHRLPIVPLLNACQKYPDLSFLILQHPERKKVIPQVVSMVQQADHPLHYSLIELAARERRPDLLPKLREQYAISEYGHHVLFHHLLVLSSREELTELAVQTWRKEPHTVSGASSTIWPAAYCGNEHAFRDLILVWEARTESPRGTGQNFQQIKSLLALTEEQKGWAPEKLAHWVSLNAPRFKFDSETGKYSLAGE